MTPEEFYQLYADDTHTLCNWEYGEGWRDWFTEERWLEHAIEVVETGMDVREYAEQQVELAFDIEDLDTETILHILNPGLRWGDDENLIQLEGEINHNNFFKAWQESREYDDLLDYVVESIEDRLEEAAVAVALNAIMTCKEVAEEFGVSVQACNKACAEEWIPSRKSGSTYLVRRIDAQKRWGKKPSAG